MRALLFWKQLLCRRQLLRIYCSIQNAYQENGVLNNFVNWSQPSQPAPQSCSITGGSAISGIGPFSSTLNATKLLQFSPAQGVKKMLIKIGVGVSDSQLVQQSNQTSSSQSVQFITINGSVFQVTTNTVTNQATRTIPFVTLELRDLLAANSIIKTEGSGYQVKSTT